MKKIGQEQKDFLRTVASLAYGTGFREGSKGGKGHMALLSVGKKLRVIKCNTHFNHASKVQNEIASSTDAQNVRKQLIEGSALLREKLYGIGRSLGFTDEQLVKSLGSLDNKTTLLTR